MHCSVDVCVPDGYNECSPAGWTRCTVINGVATKQTCNTYGGQYLVWGQNLACTSNVCRADGADCACVNGCPEDNPCSSAYCNAATDSCAYTPDNEGGACVAGPINGICVSGTCTAVQCVDVSDCAQQTCHNVACLNHQCYYSITPGATCAGGVCSPSGDCVPLCVDECVQSGTTLQCVNDELFLCQDSDGDGCLERTVTDHCLYGCDGNLCCAPVPNPNICGTPDGCGGTYPGDCPSGQHCALVNEDYACFGNCPDWCAPTFTPPVVEYRPVSECVEAIYHIITELVPSCSVPNVCERVPGPMTEEYQGDRLLNDEPCGAGLCKAGECVPECLSGPDVPGCRASQPRGAISATGACTGTQACYKCPQNTVWTGTECRDLGYEIRVDDVTVIAGQQAIINPQTYDERSNPVSVMYYYTGFREEMTNMPLSIITQPDEVGVHSLTITARKVQAMDQTLSTRSIDIGVTCPANSQCCTEGATRWNEGASCTVVGGSRGSCGSDGVCRADGVLQQEGTAWNNCDDGLDNDRDGPYDCIKVNGRVETGCTEYCRGIFCDQGLAVCGEDCADLETDRSHCGTCSQACNENQVCEQAKCISKEGCFVACDKDSDCGTDRVCVNKGSCDANVTEPVTFTKCDGAWHLHERDGLSLPVRFAYFRDRTIKPMNRARGSGSYS